MRTLAHLVVSVLLAIALIWGGCLACTQDLSPMASCCQRSSHCHKNVTAKPVATQAAAIAILPAPTVTAAMEPPAPAAEFRGASHLVSPDLCLLHSVLRV